MPITVRAPLPESSRPGSPPRGMSLWSRILQAITAVGDSVAAFFSGRERVPERSIAFTIGVIALGAKMAKADGLVTLDEIAAFKQVFHVPEAELAGVARIFNLAKQDIAGYEYYARHLARLFKTRPQVLEDVLDSLFHIAKADSAIHAGELAFLEGVASHFGFDARQFARIKARHVESGHPDDYIILGLSPDAADNDIRTEYRKLVREHHPDRHIAAGMPLEIIDVATERLARINAAYDAIARERGL
jgi:DnaJ like chaperone protein